MRILQLIHKIQNRGAETFACQLSNNLVDLGHEVLIVSLYNGDAHLPFKGKIISLNANSSIRLLDISGWYKLNKIIGKFKPDVIQANAGDTLKYAVFTKLIFKYPGKLIFRNASEVGRYLKSPIQRVLNKFLYYNTDFVISVSKRSEKDILQHFPFLSGKTIMIPIGLEDVMELTSYKYQPEQSYHIVHVGGFSFEKNHEGLIRIFELLLKKGIDVYLHLIGGGALKKLIEERVIEKGLSDYVQFHGFIPNALKFIRGANILVLPSLIEGLPGVLLEAMYCKTPVIAYDVGGIKEIVNKETGTLIPLNEEEKFAEEIYRTLNERNLAKIENAFKLVNSYYMNKTLALKFVNSYKKLVSGEQ